MTEALSWIEALGDIEDIIIHDDYEENCIGYAVVAVDQEEVKYSESGLDLIPLGIVFVTKDQEFYKKFNDIKEKYNVQGCDGEMTGIEHSDYWALLSFDLSEIEKRDKYCQLIVSKNSRSLLLKIEKAHGYSRSPTQMETDGLFNGFMKDEASYYFPDKNIGDMKSGIPISTIIESIEKLECISYDNWISPFNEGIAFESIFIRYFQPKITDYFHKKH